MTDDKRLVPTVRRIIYQGENMVDEIKFLLPQKYENFEISGSTVMIQYIENEKIYFQEKLNMDDHPFRDNILSFSLPVDSAFTYKEGELEIQLLITKEDSSKNQKQILKTSTCHVLISPSYKYDQEDISEPSLPFKIKEINEKLAVINTILKEKADNISLDASTGEITLISSGEKIGNILSLKDLGNAIADHADDGLINILI